MHTRKPSIVLALMVMALLLAAAVPAWGAAQNVDVNAGSSKAGAATNYTIAFTCSSAVYSGDQIAVIFPGAFGDANAAIDRVAVNGAVYSFSAQRQAAGMWILYYTGTNPNPIPAGVNYAVYFNNIVNPATAGRYQITVRSPYPADSGAQGSVSIVPADPVRFVLEGITDEDSNTPGIQVTAGTVQNIVVRLADRYGNVGAENNTGKDISVELADTDAQANFGSNQTATVTIAQKATGSAAPASWTPKTAGTVTVSATDVTQNPNPQMQPASVTVQVGAAVPAKILLDGPSYLDKDAEGTYTVSLKDDYDNPASPDSTVSVNLSADSGSGVTFTPNPVEIPSGQSSGTFTFKSSQANMYTITATGTGLTQAEKKVAVGVTVLAELAITAPQTGEVSIASEVAIALKDQFGNAFAAPEGGVTVDLDSDNSGTFYNAPANGAAISWVTIPKGQSAAKVYYVPAISAVGAHNLTFTAPQLLSDGRPTGTNLTAQATINVGTAAACVLDVSLPGFTAGQRGGITITVVDAHGNQVPSGQGGRVVYLETNSPTGKFYAAADGGDPIDQATIPAGQASVTVYYVDTESWTRKALEDGKLSSSGINRPDYSYTLAFRSEGVRGYSSAAIVQPAAAKDITLDLAAQNVDAVSDEEWVQIGSQIGATDLIGTAYMRVGIVDQYGNPVPQNNPPRVISVKDDSASAFMFWDYAELDNGEWAEEGDAWLIVTAPGTYTVTASAAGFTSVQKQVAFQEPSLVIDAPATAVPDDRVRVTLRLTNLWASGRNLTVDLATSTQNSAFYATDQTAEPITKATIPAYSDQVTVWLESDDPLGTAVGLTASIADLNLTAQATVTLGWSATGNAALNRGWNIVSTPWELESDKNTIDKILANPDYVEQAYGYANGGWYQVTTAQPETMVLRPLEALYIKLKGSTGAVFWAKRGLGTPPVRDLAAGWNLVGNPTVIQEGQQAKKVNEALSSISGSYAVVISPFGCSQSAWVYTPQTATPPNVENFRGYWVYMTKADRLAGQAMPPL